MVIETPMAHLRKRRGEKKTLQSYLEKKGIASLFLDSLLNPLHNLEFHQLVKFLQLVRLIYKLSRHIYKGEKHSLSLITESEKHANG